MTFSIDHLNQTRAEAPRYRQLLFPLVATMAFLVFLAAPWPLPVKAHMLLHGLCAQRPSHSFTFGGQRLPFDARMTGIYAGFFLSSIALVCQGRHRSGKLPRIWLMVVLAGLVGAMAADGFNSLLLDMNLPHPYPPSNAARLATGLGVGMTLAVALAYLAAISLWRRPRMDRAVIDGRGLALLALSQLPAVVFLTGWPWILAPLTIVLLCAAVAVISLLALVSLVLITRADNSFQTVKETQGYASAAMLLGLATIGALAALRFLFERHFGPSPLN